MALLSNASIFCKDQDLNIKLLTKIGDDPIAKQLTDELKQTGVDLFSPLFKRGDPGSTTGLTNVIVSQSEYTRTCLHTPGSCGELETTDVEDDILDEVFRNVVHLHLDGRHTDAALVLAREATRRRITVSIDVEKDRYSSSLDSLLELADIVFMNSDQCEEYLNRLNREFEEENHLERFRESKVIASNYSQMTEHDLEFYYHLIRPSNYFTRRFGQERKEIVITKGQQGALSISTLSITDTVIDMEKQKADSKTEITKKSSNVVQVQTTIADKNRSSKQCRLLSAHYEIHSAGVLSNVKVVDTTGAGDAFIAGYLMTRKILCLPAHLCLQFGCWVGGRKLQGVGARSALPTATDVDNLLGTSVREMQTSLGLVLCPFQEQPAVDSSLPAVESWESFGNSGPESSST
jgi:sugar/nucleoside kinase (ribokinase family)